MKRTNAQGNVIFIILIAIALFGSLTYAVTQGFSGASTSRITKQQAKAAASAIIKYTDDVAQAVSRMQLVNNCDDEQISFERAPFDGSDTEYVNANAPGDFSCHVFHPSGGGVAYNRPSTDYLNPADAAEADYGDYVFIVACVNDIGTSGEGPACNSEGNDSDYTELNIFLPYVSTELCEAMNIQLGYAAAPEEDDGTLWSDGHKFSGTYSSSAVYIGDGGSSGDYARCLAAENNPKPGSLHFYRVLLPR